LPTFQPTQIGKRVQREQTDLPKSTEITVDMKMEFCTKIKKLPIESLQSFVEFAQNVQGTSVSALENEKF
jgi:hypothetical protein